MRSVSTWLGLAALAAGLTLVPRRAGAQTDGRPAVALRRAQANVDRLRADLARANADVATLKRAGRSLRNDYRLRERMADAEALAQKLTQAEASLHALRGDRATNPGGAPIVASPQVSAQDGSVELEAKADLLVDQARKLDGEANALTRAADQLRTRKALRRKAWSWERDPFNGLETSKRNLAVSAPAQKTALPSPGSDSNERGGASTPTTPPPPVTGETTGTSGTTPTLGPGTGVAGGDTTSKTAAVASPSDSAGALKSSPLSSSAATDRQAVEQRLYLDPATAAELRHALGAGGSNLDPEALERGATALHARARVLEAQARTLRAKSRAP